MSSTNNSVYKEMLAGLGGSMMSTILLHPIDTIKLNQIVQQKPFLYTIRTMYGTNNNWHIFYRALFVNVAAYSSTYSIYFAINKYVVGNIYKKIKFLFPLFQ